MHNQISHGMVLMPPVILTSVINSQMPEGKPSQSGRQGKELCVCVVGVTLVCYSWNEDPVSDFQPV